MEYLDCVLGDADIITEGLEEVVEVLGGAMLVGRGTLDGVGGTNRSSLERVGALDAFSLLERILWRNIRRGSYWGWFRGWYWSSFDLSRELGVMREAIWNMLSRLLVYTREPEEPSIWIPS